MPSPLWATTAASSLRYSGTEPLARVMVEAEHQADVQRFSQSVADALRFLPSVSSNFSGWRI